MSGMFEEKPMFFTEGPVCPKCTKGNTFAEWRDRVWEETGYRCKDCGNTWIKG